MNRSILLRRILLAPPPLRSTLLPLSFQAIQPSLPRQYATSPNIAQTSFWVSLIPKPFRKSSRNASKKKVKSKEWNPATFYICIFLLIGSMAIQMIALRNEFAAFSRRADAKIGLLKEVIERIQNGEDVDVEGLLGAGDAEREKEWEEVLQEIEREDEAWEQSQKHKTKHGRVLEERPQGSEKTTNPTTKVEEPLPKEREKPKSKAPSGFY